MSEENKVEQGVGGTGGAQQPVVPGTVIADGSSPHRPPDDKEEVYFDGSPKLRAEFKRIFGYFVVGAILIAIPIVLAVLRKEFPWWLWPAGILAGILVCTWPWILVRTLRYRITNYRIDFERGLLSKNIDTIELWHVEDIHFHQSIWARMLNVGNITVISRDASTPRLELFGVPNPRPLYETLKQRVISVKRQSGVMKMDPG